jgi:hypothetical protein
VIFDIIPTTMTTTTDHSALLDQLQTQVNLVVWRRNDVYLRIATY